MGRFALTPTRLAIIEFIRRYTAEHGRFPMREEIAKACGIKSETTLHYHLRVLEQAGYLKLPEARPSRTKTQSRLPGQPTSEIMQWAEKAETIPVPLVGTLTTSQLLPTTQPISLPPSPEEIIPVPAYLARASKGLFALRVKGEPIVDACVLEDDIIILEQARTVENGQMAAVWLRDENRTTLRKVYREGDCIRLQPANRTIRPTYHSPEDVDIQGRVVAVIRKFEP